MFRGRRGQEGTSGKTASLIAIILACIILYILFLPPDEREELLKENTTDSDDDDDIRYKSEQILLREYIGSLEYFNQRVCDYDDTNRYCEHPVPNINLFETRSAIELGKMNAVYVKSGTFEKEHKTMTFAIEDLEKTSNVQLSFVAEQREGRLVIKLNEEVIFENEIDKSNPEPIALPDDLLQTTNKLEFAVSGVGGAFWDTNEYLLSNLKVIGEVQNNDRQTGTYSFSINPTENENLERAWLEFYPVCNPRNVGVLYGYVNGNRVFSAVPECEVRNKQEIRIGYLDSGSNDISFTTEKGSYLIEKIQVLTEIKEVDKATFYFELNSTEYDNVLDGERQVNITFFFVHDDDYVDDIEFKLNVNGHLAYIDNRYLEGRSRNGERITRGYYSRIIDEWVEEGNNYIQIEPKSTLEIKEMRVSIYDVD